MHRHSVTAAAATGAKERATICPLPSIGPELSTVGAADPSAAFSSGVPWQVGASYYVDLCHSARAVVVAPKSTPRDMWALRLPDGAVWWRWNSWRLRAAVPAAAADALDARGFNTRDPRLALYLYRADPAAPRVPLVAAVVVLSANAARLGAAFVDLTATPSASVVFAGDATDVGAAGAIAR